MKFSLKNNQIKYIFFILIIVAIFSFYLINPKKYLEMYTIIDRYIGIMVFPLLLNLFLTLFTLDIKNKVKKSVFEIRLYLFFIFCLTLLYLIIIHSLHGFNDLIDLKTIDKETYLQTSIYKYNIGLIPSYILYYLLYEIKGKFFYKYLAIVFINILSIFLVIFRPTKNFIMNSYNEYRYKRRLELEEKLILEQIAIKEKEEKKILATQIQKEENIQKDIEREVKIFAKLVPFIEFETDNTEDEDIITENSNEENFIDNNTLEAKYEEVRNLKNSTKQEENLEDEDNIIRDTWTSEDLENIDIDSDKKDGI